MLSDLRFVLRTLGRNRGFAAITVLTIALGIGAATSIFSVSYWTLFRTGKFSEDVFLLGGQTESATVSPMRFDFQARAYEAETRVLAGVARAAMQRGNVVVEGRPVAPMWMGVTPNAFSLLGISVKRGRAFSPGEGVAGSDEVVVVTHWFWQKFLGGDEDAVGRKIVVGNSVCTVVGILGAEQNLPPYINAPVYRPLVVHVDPAQPWTPPFFVFAKLAPGVTREQAQAALRGAKPDVPAMLAQYFNRDRVVLSSMADFDRLGRPEVYWLMVAAVAFLYLIASLNASNLMLVRMLGLRRELCIRLALGGGRWQSVRLLFIESVVLAGLASLLGLLLANWFFPLLLAAAGSPISVSGDWTTWRLGWRSVGVMGVLAVLTSVFVTILPAVRVLRMDLGEGLKEGGAAVGEGRGLARLRGALVALQATFAVILLTGAGLMVQTFANFQKVDLGFKPDRLAKVYLNLPPDYPTEKESGACLVRLREIQAELARLPGVRGVAFGQDVLLPGFYFAGMTLEGPEGKEVKASMAGFNIGYQEVTGITLKRGRWLDQPMGNAVMINETLARVLFGDKDPIGQFVRLVGGNSSAGPGWKGWEIAGVVGDVRGTLRDPPGNLIYTPEGWGSSNLTTFVLRLGSDEVGALDDQVRRLLYAFDPRIVVHQAQSFSEYRAQLLWQERIADSVLKVLAAVALGLTVVGIFSVLAYTVDLRMGEFGIRMALGATSGDLAALVVKRGVILTAVGVATGMAGSIAAARMLKTLLYETTPTDPAVLGAVGALLLLTSLLACAWPARRAAKVDVARLLRSE